MGACDNWRLGVNDGVACTANQHETPKKRFGRQLRTMVVGSSALGYMVAERIL